MKNVSGSAFIVIDLLVFEMTFNCGALVVNFVGKMN